MMNAHTFLNKHFTLLHRIGLFIGLALSVIYADHQILGGDQYQMLLKGYLGAYSNIWLSYGNAASAVGNVPGFLSGWLVGFPLLLWDSPWAPMVLLLALRLISFLLLDAVIKQAFDNPMRLVFLALYWLNPWLLYDSLLYNPSYLCLFAAMHIWSSFKMKEGKSFIYSFIHVLSIGMAMQLHYSWPVLVVISLYLFYRNMGKISWLGVFAACLTVMVSLIPYFQDLAVNDDLKRESQRYIGYGIVHVYPVLKAILYWIRYGSFLFSNKVIANTSFDWATTIEPLQLALQYLWKGVVFLVGGVSVVISAKFNWKAWKVVRPILKRSDQYLDNKTWLMLYAFAAVLSIFISAALSPITFSYWHLIMIYPFALIPIMVAIQEWKADNPLKFSKIALFAVGYLIAVNLIASHDSRKYSYQVDYAEQVELLIHQHKNEVFQKKP